MIPLKHMTSSPGNCCKQRLFRVDQQHFCSNPATRELRWQTNDETLLTLTAIAGTIWQNVGFDLFLGDSVGSVGGCFWAAWKGRLVTVGVVVAWGGHCT